MMNWDMDRSLENVLERTDFFLLFVFMIFRFFFFVSDCL